MVKTVFLYLSLIPGIQGWKAKNKVAS